jgi:hypothetical protein
MKLVKTTIGALAVVAMLAVPATTMAAAPEGTLEQASAQKDNTDYTTLPNKVAEFSARVIQNGQWVSGHNELAGTVDWAPVSPSKGVRADAVQSLLGHN